MAVSEPTLKKGPSIQSKWKRAAPWILFGFVILIVIGVVLLPSDAKQELFVLDALEKPKGYQMEEASRMIMERILNIPFPKIRPSFLRYPPTGRCLELDGYNETWKIAFEYNGAQHDHYTPHYHRDEQAFFDMQQRDKYKEEVCKKKGIFLVSIPHTVRKEELYRFIYNELVKEKRIRDRIDTVAVSVA